MNIFLVTGSDHKLSEWQAILPDDIHMERINVDLDEIQSDDPEKVVVDKVKRAYKATGKPVVVEDVSAGLDKFKGLPGPFIKYFIQKIGKDALYQLAGKEGERAIVSCSIAYYDGTNLLTVRGDVPGTVVADRGGEAFGFDSVFIPDGETETFAQMTKERKNSLSHRSKAIHLFIDEYHKLHNES